LYACSATTAAESGKRDASVQAVGAAAGSGAEDAGAGCKLLQATRTYVGFSEDMTLADFELAAVQSTELLHTLKARLCARAPELDPSGALLRDLRAQRIEVYEILFTAANASAADVGLRAIESGDDAGASGKGYRLRAEVRISGWEILSASPG